MKLRFEFDPDTFDWTSVAVPLQVRQTPEDQLRTVRDHPDHAADWVRRRAVSGDHRAQVTWGHMLLAGHGAAKDPEAALRWFKRAARAGDAEGANMAGRCYELGIGIPASMGEAAVWYRIAAAGNDAWACFNLACLLLKGEDGVDPDIVEAMRLLVRSARMGNPKAMNMIARSLEEGWRGPVKIAAARRWYARAARGGCFRGQYHTARFLLRDGDVDGAAYWMEQSIQSAPNDFCSDMADRLEADPHPRLRELGRLARLRAENGMPTEADPLPNETAAAKPSRSQPKAGLARGRSWFARARRGPA